MNTRNIAKVVVAVLALGALAFQLASGSVSLRFHEFFGLGVAALLIAHLGLNANRWKKDLPALFKAGTPGITKLTYLVTALLLVCALVLVGTGLTMRGAVDAGQGGGTLAAVHAVSAALILVLVGVHIGLNWGFIVHLFGGAAKIPQTARRAIAGVLLVVIAGAGLYAAVASGFGSLLKGQTDLAPAAAPTRPGRTPGSFPSGGNFPSGFGGRTPGGQFSPGGQYTPRGQYTPGQIPSGRPTAGQYPTSGQYQPPSGNYTPGAGRRGNSGPGSGSAPTINNGNAVTGALEYLAIIGLFAVIAGGLVWLSRRGAPAVAAAPAGPLPNPSVGQPVGVPSQQPPDGLPSDGPPSAPQAPPVTSQSPQQSLTSEGSPPTQDAQSPAPDGAPPTKDARPPAPDGAPEAPGEPTMTPEATPEVEEPPSTTPPTVA